MKLIFEEPTPVYLTILKALTEAKRDNRKVSCIEVTRPEYECLVKTFGDFPTYQTPTSLGKSIFEYPLAVVG